MFLCAATWVLPLITAALNFASLLSLASDVKRSRAVAWSLTIWSMYSLSKSLPLMPFSLSHSFWWSASGPAGAVKPHSSANGFMLADIALCSVTIFFAKAFTAGLVAFSSANSLSLISLTSACAAVARNFLSLSSAALALLGSSIAAQPSIAQHVSLVILVIGVSWCGP